VKRRGANGTGIVEAEEEGSAVVPPQRGLKNREKEKE